METRLIVDAPLPGATNMALDEVLLENVGANGRATLRFYRWSEPTLSLGYFQRYDERYGHAASAGCALVRRSTGGGAILHDRELTYCLAVPTADERLADNRRLYDAVHEALVAELAALGMTASLHQVVAAREAESPAAEPRLFSIEPARQPGQPSRTEDLSRPEQSAASAAIESSAESASPASSLPASSSTASSSTGAREPFLCFQRRAAGDVVLSGFKVCGSAQRRQHGVVLQHGSLLLARSPRAPELPGLEELGEAAVDLEAFRQRWCDGIARRLDLVLRPSCWEKVEIERASRLELDRYRSADWNRRR